MIRENNRYQLICKILSALYVSAPLPAVLILSAGSSSLRAAVAVFAVLVFASFAIQFIDRAGIFLTVSVIFFTIDIAAAVLLDREYAMGFLNPFFLLNINIYLAFILHVVDRYFPLRTIEHFSVSIELLLFLMASYFILLHSIKMGILFTDQADISVKELTVELYDILNLLPVFMVIIRLRRHSSRRIVVSSGTIMYQNMDIAHNFSENQRSMLLYLLMNRGVGLTCETISELLGTPCENVSNCKPSICQMYNRHYRQVMEINKKLMQMQIGSIVSPENKQHIRRQGWMLQFYNGVKIQVKRDLRDSLGAVKSGDIHSEDIPARALVTGAGDRDEHAQSRYLRYLFLVPVIGFGTILSFANCFEIFRYYGNGTEMLLPVISTLMFLLMTLPIFFRKPPVFTAVLLSSMLICQGLCLFFGKVLPANNQLFIVIRNIVVYFALFLLQYQRYRNDYEPAFSWQIVSRGVFWLLWFYLAGFLVSRDVLVYHFSSEAEYFWQSVLIVMDYALYVLIFLNSFIFLRLKTRQIRIHDHALYLENTMLSESISDTNNRLMHMFFKSKTGVLTCSDIAEDCTPTSIVCAAIHAGPVHARYTSVHINVSERFARFWNSISWEPLSVLKKLRAPKILAGY